jgi:HEAT repeat protein
MFLFATAVIAQDDDKDKKDKKDKNVPPETKVLNKTIGEWVKILREHDNPKFRRAALIALEVSNASRNTGLPAILDALEKDSEPQVRIEVVNLLSRMGPEVRPSLKALMAALQNDKSDQVREAVATAIANKFADPAVEYLDVMTNALKDPHPGTRLAVVGALRNMGRYAATSCPALITVAEDPKEPALVRAGAVHIISRHAKENAKTVPLLASLAKASDTHPALREAAIEGLGLSNSDAADVIETLSAALSEKNVEIRKTAAAALGSLGGKARAAWPAVKGRLTEKTATYEPDNVIRNHLIRLTGTLGRSIDDAIPVLIEISNLDPSTENRIAAIQELGELGGRAKTAVKALEGIASGDARAAVREAADKAVQKIKGS